MELTAAFLKLFFWLIYIVGPILLLLVSLIVLLGIIVTKLEKWRLYDGLYWAFITATTVGYGDFRPLKKLAKALSILIAILGMMFTGIVISVTLKTASITIDKHIDPILVERIKTELE